MRVGRWVAIALLVMTACRPDSVALRYEYPEGTETTYRLTAIASSQWNIGGTGSGRYTAEFEVTETILSTDPDGSAVVSVRMAPKKISEDGLPAPSGALRTFNLRLGPRGEVLEVLQVDDIPASNLDPDQSLFIGTYRPPLPRDPVRLDDTWETAQQVELPESFQRLMTTGMLGGFDADSEGSLARLRFTGEGPLNASAALPQGEAGLDGTISSSSRATLDIDAGVLRDARSVTVGDFDVRIASGEELPITGTLRLRLELEIERLP